MNTEKICRPSVAITSDNSATSRSSSTSLPSPAHTPGPRCICGRGDDAKTGHTIACMGEGIGRARMLDSGAHTPGPWHISKDPEYPGAVIMAGRGNNERMVADCNIFIGTRNPKNMGNAARIVACVNAMEGEDDPAHWRRRILDLRSQRDALAALLDRFVTLVEAGNLAPKPRVYLDGLLAKSRAALSRLEQPPQPGQGGQE